MRHSWIALSILAALAGSVYAIADRAPVALGIFEGQADIGAKSQAGKVLFNASTNSYALTGGGANMWSTTDAFHFVYTRISGDVTFSADVRFEGAGTDPHRKAALMIRQDLEPSSAYADVALHGDGMTALQYRPAAGVETSEFRAPMKSPSHLRIVRRGNEFTIYAGNPGEPQATTGPVIVTMRDPVYLGIAVCSHNAAVLETAVFSKVQIAKGAMQ